MYVYGLYHVDLGEHFLVLTLIDGLVLTVSVRDLIECWCLLIYWKRILDFVNGLVMVVIQIIIRFFFKLTMEKLIHIVLLSLMHIS